MLQVSARAAARKRTKRASFAARAGVVFEAIESTAAQRRAAASASSGAAPPPGFLTVADVAALMASGRGAMAMAEAEAVESAAAFFAQVRHRPVA